MGGWSFVSQTDSNVAFKLTIDGTGALISSGAFCCGPDDYAGVTCVAEIPNGYAALWSYFSLTQPGAYFLMGVAGIDTIPPALTILNTHPGGFIFAGRIQNGIRLVNTDYDWPTSYTDDLKSSNFDIAIFPNPTDGDFCVEFELKKAGEVSIFATNAQGIKVVCLLEKQYLTGGKHRLNASTDNWERGLYFLHFQGKDERTTRLLMK
jgi:hypothetical protein